MYPVITVLEINFVRKETFKVPAPIKIKPVHSKILGRIKSASLTSIPLGATISIWAKTPKSRTAVALVGPSVIKRPPPRTPPRKAAMPEANRPK